MLIGSYRSFPCVAPRLPPPNCFIQRASSLLLGSVQRPKLFNELFSDSPRLLGGQGVALTVKGKTLFGLSSEQAQYRQILVK
jgi:hypothetical protein